MYVRRPLFRQPQRRGFTLIELLVVISIIATLAALVLPAIQNARATARRTQCSNNIRNINVAIQAYATSHSGKIPRLTDSKNLISYGTTLATTPAYAAPWSVSLLPYMEQVTLYDRLRQSVNTSATDTSPNSTNGLARTAIKAFICPDDPNGGDGSMSYVANAGYMDSTRWSVPTDELHSTALYDYAFNSTTMNADDKQVAYASGVFWRDQDTTIDQISSGDGTSQTIFLSENLNVTNYSVDGTGYTMGGWSSPFTGDIAFAARVLSTYTTGLSTVTDAGTQGGIGSASPSAKSTGLILSGSAQSLGFANPPAELSKINFNLAGATDSQSPRPSSLHPGVVNMAFGDGSVKVISQDIDDTVYLRLLTPFGGRYGQNVLADTAF